MGDMTRLGPNEACLFGIASSQHGHFTTEQARSCGYSASLVAHHAKTGRFRRLRRGLYRLRDYPSAPADHVVASWLALGGEPAAVSHASALALLGLSDIVADRVHLTVPRSRRHLPRLPGAVVHTASRPLGRDEVTIRDGLLLTNAARSILDAAEYGVAPEQIEAALRQATARGLVTPSELRDRSRQRSPRVQKLVAQALHGAGQ